MQQKALLKHPLFDIKVQNKRDGIPPLVPHLVNLSYYAFSLYSFELCARFVWVLESLLTFQKVTSQCVFMSYDFSI